MIAPPPILDLDDAGSLEAADTPGALRSAATGGAQVRAAAEAVREDLLTRLTGLRPRGVLFVANSGRAVRAASLLVAVLGARAGLPVTVLPTLPPWVGPLDVVVVAGDDAGDPRLADAVDRAVRRGAEVVVSAPDEGPLQVAGAGRTITLPPRVAVLGDNTLLHHFAVGLAVLRAVDPTHTAGVIPDLDALAERLDAEAAIGHPRNEVFHNPAKALASRMQGREVLVAGDSPGTVELARHISDMLLRVAGRVGGAAGLADAVAADLASGAVAATPGYDPLFHDAEFDGPPPRDAVRVFVLSVDDDEAAARRRIAALPDAELVAAGSASAPADAAPAGEIEQLAVLAVRWEMAAAYLRLVGGVVASGAA